MYSKVMSEVKNATQSNRKEDIVFGIKEPQPLERASIRVVPLDRRQMELFFPSLEVGKSRMLVYAYVVHIV